MSSSSSYSSFPLDLSSSSSSSSSRHFLSLPHASSLSSRHVLSLPDDVLFLIFSLLDSVSLSRAARVCRRWRRFVAGKTLWRRVRLPSLTKQHLRSFICRRLDEDCLFLGVQGSCVLPVVGDLHGSARARKTLLSPAVLQLLLSKASSLQHFEIQRDNFACAEVSLNSLLQFKLSSLSLISCLVDAEFFFSPPPSPSLPLPALSLLSSLDMTGCNRIDDFFICQDINRHLSRFVDVESKCQRLAERLDEPVPADPITLAPVEDLPPASAVFLLQFPALRTLKLNNLFRLRGRAIKMLTAWYNDAGKRVSLRERLLHLELSRSNLGDDAVAHLPFFSRLTTLHLDGPQHMTPHALEILSSMKNLEVLSVDRLVNSNKISDSLGISIADQAMDRLLFRILRDFPRLRHFSFGGIFARHPPFSSMTLTWPFVVEHLPTLKTVSFCDRKHLFDVRGTEPFAVDRMVCRRCQALQKENVNWR